MLTMVLGGLWHGAGWNFVVWGGLHGAYLAAERLWSERRGDGPGATGVRRVLGALVTSHLAILAWIFFRARPIGDQGALEVALLYLGGLADLGAAAFQAPPFALWIPIAVLILDALQARAGDAHFARRWPAPARSVVAAGLWLAAFVFASGDHRAFVYFQF